MFKRIFLNNCRLKVGIINSAGSQKICQFSPDSDDSEVEQRDSGCSVMKGTTVSGTAGVGIGVNSNNCVVLIDFMFRVMTFALLLQGAGSWGELYLQNLLQLEAPSNTRGFQSVQMLPCHHSIDCLDPSLKLLLV